VRARLGDHARGGPGLTTAHEPGAGWVTVLDGLEGDLDRLEASFDAGDVLEVRPWVPPSGLGPLPEHLRDRAADLLARSRDLRDEIRDASAEALGQARRNRQRREATAAYRAAG
jgi:hypothetical protein